MEGACAPLRPDTLRGLWITVAFSLQSHAAGRVTIVSNAGRRPSPRPHAGLPDDLRGAGGRAMSLTFEGYRLDLARRELSLAGAVIATTPKVFDLLAYLVQN